jgi:hypothetical protein
MPEIIRRKSLICLMVLEVLVQDQFSLSFWGLWQHHSGDCVEEQNHSPHGWDMKNRRRENSCGSATPSRKCTQRPEDLPLGSTSKSFYYLPITPSWELIL